ncbi:MAG: NADH-quinone oxidoreductase subunit H [Candidatus Magnetomorum sp.]|nr:NADH-quinone oxidoreductase subunit H [Candidatus Magnetomorum sp.]
MESFLVFLSAVFAAPFFSGVILKVKAFFGGKKGPSVFIPYYTLIKLFQKASVYSKSTTYIFKLSPMISLTIGLLTLLFFPFAGRASVLSFNGDIIAIVYFMALGRFFTILAALDTASPFEGMGAAREAYFSIIAEATLFMILLLFYLMNRELNLSSYLMQEKSIFLWKTAGSSLLFIIVSLFMLLLAENSRVPVDDPSTHLELTMIHEVMILDHSGPDLALIELGASLKLLFYASFIARLIFPFDCGYTLFNVFFFFMAVGVVYVAIGITESMTARFKMTSVPIFIMMSFALAFFATVFNWELIK